MALLSPLARLFGRAPPPEPARFEPSFSRDANFGGDEFLGNGVKSAAGAFVSQSSAMQVTTVFACVSMISYDIAKLGAGLFSGQKKGSNTRAKGHFLDTLLTRPHPLLTPFDFFSSMQMGVLLRGNAYAVIIRDGRGKPIKLWPVNPDRVAIWEAPDGSLFCLVTRMGLFETAQLRELPLMIPYDDVLHLKGLSANGLTGLSPISMEREAIGLAIAQEQTASYFANHAARPSGVLSTDQKLTPESRKAVETAWKNSKGGAGNAGRSAILEAGLKWTPLSLTSVDMEFIAARNFQASEIARIFRVPGYKLGLDAKGGGKSSLTQMAQEYLNDTLSTWIVMWEQRLIQTFEIDPTEMYVDFDESRILEADMETRYAANRIALGGQPWRIVNEIRAEEGLPPAEGGDTLFRPVNMAPADSDVFAGMADPNDPTVPGDTNLGAGSEQTGEGAPGGGRPNDDGSPASDSKIGK